MGQGEETYLLWGGTGWIGGILKSLLEESGKRVVVATSRIENRQDVERELDSHKPSNVLVAAGLTGRPNVDWCETNREATVRVNVCGTINVADLCSTRSIHCTIFATGCIYEYDDGHPVGGKGFTEEDEPNYAGSYYSKTKIMVEELLKAYSSALILRLRMPISDRLCERNFVYKIARYHRVVDVPNSMSVLTELLPLSLAMAGKGLTGIYNFTNPGVISHNEVLALYQAEVDPDFAWENFSVQEQASILAAGRSNNCLDTTKLEAAAAALGMPLPDIHSATRAALRAARKHLEAEGNYPAGLPKKLGPGNRPV